MGSTNNPLVAFSSKWDQFTNRLVELSTQYGMSVVGAIIILVAGLLFARWVGNSLQRWLGKQQMEPPVRTLFVRVARLLVLMLTLVTVLDRVGFPVTSVIAGIGVAGVGLGLALQGVLSNLVAGLTIIFTKPFRVGEYIELASVHGQVQHIELFSTVLLHADLSHVVIPNRKIVGEILHNYGGIRQLSLSVGVDYGSDINQVLALTREILGNHPRVLKNPAPFVGIAALSDSSITITLKPWTSLADYGATQAEIYELVLNRFRNEGIEIPFPQREVRMLQQA